MYNNNDTIAAPATANAIGGGGITVIRISGSDTLSIIKTLTGRSDFTPRHAYYQNITDPKNNTVIDDGVIIYYKAPKSFTGEDIAELSVHGGYYIVTTLMETLSGLGVRVAEPGEFTERAFLNGKIDLIKAEAVVELINAQSEMSHKTARGHLDGVLSKNINTIKEDLLTLVMHLEAELDFSEEEIDLLPVKKIKIKAEETLKKIEALLDTYHDGLIVSEGLKTVILGRANAGKSSFFNLLLKKERAIVTDIEGTTRDLLEEVLNIKGLTVKLIDTAGLRDTDEKVELIGIKKARAQAIEADLIIYMVDLTAKSFNDDFDELVKLEKEKVFVLLNKTDLVEKSVVDNALDKFEDFNPIEYSVLAEEKLEVFEDALLSFALQGKDNFKSIEGAGAVVTSVRHRELLELALKGTQKAIDGIDNDITRDLLASDLRWAMDKLGEITGVITTEDILGRIFSNFCVGK